MRDHGLLADERVELLDGELVMNPPPNPPHATVTTLLDGVLRELYRDAGARHATDSVSTSARENR